MLGGLQQLVQPEWLVAGQAQLVSQHGRVGGDLVQTGNGTQRGKWRQGWNRSARRMGH